ncbi:MAG: SDR family oxidoreductase [Planctomycetota bacterium]
MRIAVTGATGFLGRSLLQLLSADGHTLVAWARSPESASRHDFSVGVEWRYGQLGSAEDAAALVRDCDAIVHAGLVRPTGSFLDSGTEPLDYWHRNVTGSLQLLEASKSARLRRFIFVSSGAVHDRVIDGLPLNESHPHRPATLYGAYKAAVESLVHHYGTANSGTANFSAATEMVTATVRPPVIYGINEPIESSRWYELVRRICLGENVHAVNGSKCVHVEDLARSIAILLGSDGVESGSTYNCCDRMISEFEVAELAKSFSNSDAQITGAPKVAKNEIITERIQSLGMKFGGTPLLKATIGRMVRQVLSL